MRRVVTVVASTLIMAAVPSAVGSSTAANVSLTVTRGGCVASPRSIEAGAAVFRIANRTRHRALVSVAGKRTTVAPFRQGRLALTARAGQITYACHVAGRRVGNGTVRVAARPRPPLEHRIGVRQVSGFGEFFDRATGAKFVPRGNNYIRLAPPPLPPVGVHTTFNVGTYDRGAADAALRRMAAGGFNVVRVWVNAEGTNDAVDGATGELATAYVANLVDFLQQAKAHGLYVILTTSFITEGRYAAYVNAEPRTLVDDTNLLLLTRGGIRSYSEFWADVARALVRSRVNDAVFAYEIQNETSFVATYTPFTLDSGQLTAPNGQTYDLAREGEKQRLMDEAIVYWIDEIRKAIRAVDATALVSQSFFQPHGPNSSRRGDPRLVTTRPAIERSSADYIDLHPYPGVDLTLPQYMENFGVSGPTVKPLLMGEFGAFKFAYPSPATAIPALLAWQRESCRYGLDGWLLWTWDTDEQTELWNGLSDGGVIEQALAPTNRPDPCA